MVRKDWQSKKAGTKIINLLLEEIKKYKSINPNLGVYLGSSKGKENFYKKFNFISRKEANLEDGMILKEN